MSLCYEFSARETKSPVLAWHITLTGHQPWRCLQAAMWKGMHMESINTMSCSLAEVSHCLEIRDLTTSQRQLVLEILHENQTLLPEVSGWASRNHACSSISLSSRLGPKPAQAATRSGPEDLRIERQTLSAKSRLCRTKIHLAINITRFMAWPLALRLMRMYSGKARIILYENHTLNGRLVLAKRTPLCHRHENRRSAPVCRFQRIVQMRTVLWEKAALAMEAVDVQHETAWS
jgi:hypothetical protein